MFCENEFIFSLSGKDFNEKMVGKTLFQPNEDTSTIDKFVVRGMYKDGTKIVVAFFNPLMCGIQHLSYEMTDSSGLYSTEKDANKILLKRKIFKVTNSINTARRYVNSREKQIELLKMKLITERENLAYLEKNLEILKK